MHSKSRISLAVIKSSRTNRFHRARRNLIAINVRSSNLHRIAIEFREDTGEAARNIMSAQIRRPLGSIAFASALIVPGWSVIVLASTARAADCLAAPDPSAPKNSRWYYRTIGRNNGSAGTYAPLINLCNKEPRAPRTK
jgi:hypothetical protein